MEDFKLDILRELKKFSTPYVDIRKLSSEYDCESEYFVAAYLQLEAEGLIASANTDNCGLKISSDGFPFWSIVNVYVTKKGDLVLNPPKVNKLTPLLAITNNATFATVVGGIILIILVTVLIQPLLSTTQKSDQKNSENIKQ